MSKDFQHNRDEELIDFDKLDHPSYDDDQNCQNKLKIDHIDLKLNLPKSAHVSQDNERVASRREEISQRNFISQVLTTKPALSSPKIDICDHIPNLITEVNLTEFLKTPVKEGAPLQCHIAKVTSACGCSSRYQLFLTEQNVHLLTAVRVSRFLKHAFLITSNASDLSKDSNNCLGYLESNFRGTQFRLFSKGKSYKETSNPAELREELGLIKYSTSLFDQDPKNFTFFVPTEKVVLKPLHRDQGLHVEQAFKANRNKRFYEFQNQKPQWSEKHQSFILNFSDRVTTSSAKNFLLKQVTREGILGPQTVVQFGRQGKTLLNLDISHPMTPVQAFALTISNLNYMSLCD